MKIMAVAALIFSAGLAPFAAGCATAPLLTEASSKAISSIKAKCASDPACTIKSIEDHGETWWITTHIARSTNFIGNDGDTFIVNKRQDRVIKIWVSE